MFLSNLFFLALCMVLRLQRVKESRMVWIEPIFDGGQLILGRDFWVCLYLIIRNKSKFSTPTKIDT